MQDRLSKTTYFKNSDNQINEDTDLFKIEDSALKSNANPGYRRYFDPERLHKLSKPRVLPKLFVRKQKSKKKVALSKKRISLDTYLNTDLPCKDEGKQIIYNTVKAAIYGLNVTEVPLLERKIDAYVAPNKKAKKLVLSSLCLNRHYTNREEPIKNVKMKSVMNIACRKDQRI